MSERDPKLRSRLLIGAIAGIAGTVAMAAAIRRLPPRLVPLSPSDENPPDEGSADLAAAGGIVRGALAGSLIAAFNPRIGRASGAAAGLAIWALGALTRLPGGALMKCDHVNPRQRNMLGVIAHVAWGMATARAMRELLAARDTSLRQNGAKGNMADRHTPEA